MEPNEKPRDLIELAKYRRKLLTVKLQATLADDKPAAVRIIQKLVSADYYAMGGNLPIPDGKSETNVDEWTPDEQGRYFAYLGRVLCRVVKQMRRCVPVLDEQGQQKMVDAELPAEEEGGEPQTIQKPAWRSEWIPVTVVMDREPDYEKNELHVDDFDRLGLESWTRITFPVLYQIPNFGGLVAMYGDVEFLDEPLRGAGADGQDVQGAAT